MGKGARHIGLRLTGSTAPEIIERDRFYRRVGVQPFYQPVQVCTRHGHQVLEPCLQRRQFGIQTACVLIPGHGIQVIRGDLLLDFGDQFRSPQYLRRIIGLGERAQPGQVVLGQTPLEQIDPPHQMGHMGSKNMRRRGRTKSGEPIVHVLIETLQKPFLEKIHIFLF